MARYDSDAVYDSGYLYDTDLVMADLQPVEVGFKDGSVIKSVPPGDWEALALDNNYGDPKRRRVL